MVDSHSNAGADLVIVTYDRFNAQPYVEREYLKMVEDLKQGTRSAVQGAA